MALIPVAKNGKFLGYADANQIAANPKLSRCPDPADGPVPEAPVAVEDPIDDEPVYGEDGGDEEGPNPEDL
jgi:hypothetical protein